MTSWPPPKPRSLHATSIRKVFTVNIIIMMKTTVLVQALCAVASLRPAVAQEQNIYNVGFTSYSVNRNCSSTVELPEGAVSMLDYSCDSLNMPSAWNYAPREDQVYDLVIVGGGASGVYMANRLVEEFKKQGQPPPVIALAERSDDVGGRLMSARGSGGLGLAVDQLDAESKNIPPEEYGGMRIDPYRYRLVWDKIIEFGQAIYGEDQCLKFEDCLEESVNCCKPLVFRMEVGNVRYGPSPSPQSAEKLGALLASSNVTVPSELYDVELVNESDFKSVLQNVTEAIANGAGSPFDKCKQLIFIADELVKETPSLGSESWKTVIDEACASTDPGVQALCAEFPGSAKYNAPISCSGYDNFDGTTAPYGAVSGLTNEVTNANLGTHLYVFKVGLQRFLQGLLYVNGTISVSPMYGKELVGVDVNGESPVADSTSQIASINVDAPMEGHDTALESSSTDVLTLKFSDGSSVRAKSAFLTMLPFDLPRIGGFEPWEETIQETLSPAMAVKLVMGWDDPADAPPAKLGLKSCAGDGTCQRAILDGPADEGWLVRQLWMWGPDTVMVYNVAGDPTQQGPTAATNMIKLGTEEGMDELVRTTMAQINSIAPEPIPMPTWARIKPWPAGSITGWKNTTQGFNIATYLQRPLGPDVPVFYGNSEAAPDSALHGWIQGGWEMVEDSLPALAKALGLKEDLSKYEPVSYDVIAEASKAAASNAGGPGTGTSKAATATATAVVSALCALLAII